MSLRYEIICRKCKQIIKKIDLPNNVDPKPYIQNKYFCRCGKKAGTIVYSSIISSNKKDRDGRKDKGTRKADRLKARRLEFGL